MHSELGVLLRRWRERVEPASAGFPAGTHRRAPGLRREEVALLSGISVDYVVKLEQGRATSASASVLTALARTLCLSEPERDHLLRLAGHAPPSGDRLVTEVPDAVRLLAERLGDVPSPFTTPPGTSSSATTSSPRSPVSRCPARGGRATPCGGTSPGTPAGS
ncbi:helix-turn-helix domain-containing protein [Saccharomonospora xinjiangensis]|uniref:helix-turn-helix domain-containing protein n=1 Tax=Saccharomonospora xinjiangensis TaxID=75294 RepID=UPI00350ECDBA